MLMNIFQPHKDEEKNSTISADEQHNKKKNNQENNNQQNNDKQKEDNELIFKQLLERLIRILEILGAISAILLFVFPAYQYWSEIPRLKLKKQALELRPDKDIIQILDGIEDHYHEVTETVILDLRDNIELLLEKKLDIEIPPGGEYELKMDEKGVDISLLEQQEIDEILKEIKDATDKIENLKKKTESSKYKSRFEQLKKVEQRLNGLYERISTKRDAMNNKRIILNLLIENHSKSKNGIRDTAVIRFYKNKEVHFPVTLTLKKEKIDDIFIDGDKFKIFRFESSLMGSMSQNKKIAIDSVFNNQYDYIFMLEDVKGNFWREEGTAVNFSLDSQSEKLNNKTDMIVKKKYSLWWWVPFL